MTADVSLEQFPHIEQSSSVSRKTILKVHMLAP